MYIIFDPDLMVVGAENRGGFLRNIGPVIVGGGVGVGVPMNDPVKVATKVEVDFGVSGLAGQLPFGFGYQGERYSLNDYDGDKTNIVPDRYAKTILKLQQIQRTLSRTNDFQPA